ncbi:hypothetical protein ACQ4PT_065381 [Festuca glaucescens]
MVKKKGAATASSAAASTTGPKAATAASKKVTPETSAAITKDAPGDWPASMMTKRDEKKARSLGLISDKEEDVLLPELSEKELLDEVRRLTHFSQEDSIPLLALHEPYDLTHQPAEVPATVKYFLAVSRVEEDPEDGDSTANAKPYAEVVEDNETSKEEDNNPFNPEAPSAKHKILDDELIDTAESSQHDNDADRVPFVTAAPETSSAQPPKRPSGGFADEDDFLLDFEEGFLEPPSKKAKTSSSRPTPTASEAPALSKEILASSSLPKEKENLSASGGHSIQAAVTIIKNFASQFTLLQAKNARLHQDIQSSFAQLDQAVKIVATDRQDADSLRKELGQLKKKLKEEEKAKTEAQAQAQVKEKKDLLRKSTTTLLGAANIPADSVGKLPADTAADAISLAIESGELVRALLQKNKAVLSRFHAMIFLKADQNKTLGQLVDTFFIDTEGIIEVAPMVPFVEDVSAAGSETGLLQQMRTRISRMEKDLLGIHAMAGVTKKKGEMAVEAERYTLNELQKATESLNFIALNLSEENKRVHERVEALMSLSQFNEVFWSSKSKAATIAKFQDRVQQVH